MIKVLWVDDEFEKLKAFKGRARTEGLDLVPFKSLNAGLEELEAKYTIYDAVLFDAKFFENETDVAGSESLSNLSFAKERLLKLPKVFELFVLTGQAKLFNDETFSAFIPKYYRKGVVEDNNKLFIDIKAFALGQIDTQIRSEYPEAFKPFQNGIINETDSALLLEIIKCDKNKDYRKKNINTQRDLLEVIFKSLNNPIPCIPDDFFDSSKNNKPNLEWCTRFLEDRETNGHKLNIRLEQDITTSLRKLKTSTSKFSHHNDEDILKTPYLSNMHLLLEVLEWLPIFVDKHYKNYI